MFLTWSLLKYSHYSELRMPVVISFKTVYVQDKIPCFGIFWSKLHILAL